MAVLFADITGSTMLFAKVGDENARRIERAWLRQVGELLPQFEGRIVKTVGDTIMCAFASADNAVRAACAMQVAVTNEPPAGQAIALHMGLHFGAVILEGDDMFGDTVNVSAYLADVAAPRQIVITDATFAMLSDATRKQARPIYQTVLKGHTDKAIIYDVIWKTGDPNLTDSFYYARTPHDVPGDSGGLMLAYQDQVFYLNKQKPRAVLGRDSACDILVVDPAVSRRHARIELQAMSFYLIDQSINGSFVIFDHGPQVNILHRDLVLEGSGRISLSRSFSENPAHFIQFSRDRRSLFHI